MDLQQARQALQEYFGYEDFRPMQDQIVQSVLDQQDSLVLMPTGGGKSICFQIPAIIKPGFCIVVSPLISLMRDQVDSLSEKGVQAACINSTLSNNEQEDVKRAAERGDLDILYVSPERLSSHRFMNFLKSVNNINLFAIDEAHCISSWGHDFRPEYTELEKLKEISPQTPIIALTATADKTTRRDIVYQLGLDFGSVNTFVASFDRPNLKLSVAPAEDRIRDIRNFIKNRNNDSGIVYCLSRKSTEYVAKELRDYGINAESYHAGMNNSLRSERQKKFIYDEVDVMCATIAFGMGIDKSNIRWVIHYNLPKNIESYYQQIGRAGRDGADSEALLFYKPSDFGKLRNFAQQSGQAKIQMAKLKHMRKYAESQVCRRKILLSYFGEIYQDHECNNCDVCKSDNEYLDGTVIAKKALSALARLKEKIEKSTLIDVLRGSKKSSILHNNYNQIKTFGAGSDLSISQWKSYIDQMINLGLIRLSYTSKDKLTITEYGKQVLTGNQEVTLVKHDSSHDSSLSKQDYSSSNKNKRDKDSLHERLRSLRTKLAREKSLAPYMIFNDATLEELKDVRPLTKTKLRDISGIGSKKVKMYGEQIIQTMIDYITEKELESVSSNISVFVLYKQNKTVNKISEKLDLTEEEVYETLLELVQTGYDVNILDFFAKRDLSQIEQALEKNNNEEDVEQIGQYLDKDINKRKLALGISFIKLGKGNNQVVYY